MGAMNHSPVWKDAKTKELDSIAESDYDEDDDGELSQGGGQSYVNLQIVCGKTGKPIDKALVDIYYKGARTSIVKHTDDKGVVTAAVPRPVGTKLEIAIAAKGYEAKGLTYESDPMGTPASTVTLAPLAEEGQVLGVPTWLFLVILAAVAGGAGYYFFVMKKN